MKLSRRSFVALLGLAPIAPAAAVARPVRYHVPRFKELSRDASVKRFYHPNGSGDFIEVETVLAIKFRDRSTGRIVAFKLTDHEEES